jgi:Protein of unknown function (DUF2971)
MEDKVLVNSFDFTEEENVELMPDYFYKYIGITSRSKENLANNQLWFSKPDKFNDPFDCRAYLNFGTTAEECKSNLRKYKRGFSIPVNPEFDDILNKIAESPNDFNDMHSIGAAKEFESFLGVSCFSEEFDNNLMWSHYANSCRGMVLEFKKDIDGFITQNMLPVNYHEEFPVINIEEYKEEQMIAVLYQFICAKSKDWSYENEWRAIVSEGDACHKYDKSELAGIIFGLNTSQNHKEEIYDLVI